jgi:hypothetical protein
MKAVLRKALKNTSDISNVEERMEAINIRVEGYGVEPIRSQNYAGGYWGDIVALYVNMGDTYTPTVVYNVKRDVFTVCSLGDFVEKFQNKYEII